MNDKEAPKRSPNFPSATLEDALANVSTLYEKDKLAATSPEVLVGHLGYNKLHGTSRRVLSSIKNYGLIDELSDNRFKVSDSAYRLINSDLNSPAAIDLLREAALKPAIFRSIIEEYDGDIPSDKTLISYLVLDRGFTPDGAGLFAKVLRENVEFANISNKLFSKNAEETAPAKGDSDMIAQQRTQQAPTPNSPLVGGQRTAENLNLPMVGTNETVLNFKISRKSEARIIFYGEDITQEAIDQLSALLTTSKIVYPTQAELENEKNRHRHAIWKNKDHDQPVTVTGKLGERDGKQYYSITESSTGISEDELNFQG